VALVQLLVARSGQLAGRAAGRKNQSLADFGSSDIANFWLLYTINTPPAGVPPLLRSRAASSRGSLLRNGRPSPVRSRPFPPASSQRDLPRYDHEHQGQSFGVLDSLLRELLETVSFPTTSSHCRSSRCAIRSTPPRSTRMRTSRTHASISLSPRTLRSPDLIARLPQLAKACSSNYIEHLVRQALPGLRLLHVSGASQGHSGQAQLPVLQHRVLGSRLGLRHSRAATLPSTCPATSPNPAMELLILLPAAGVMTTARQWRRRAMTTSTISTASARTH